MGYLLNLLQTKVGLVYLGDMNYYSEPLVHEFYQFYGVKNGIDTSWVQNNKVKLIVESLDKF